MKFFHISKPDSRRTSQAAQSEFFSLACEKRGLEYVRLTEKTTNGLSLPELEEGDLLYRSALGAWGRTVEQLLTKSNIGHIYNDWTVPLYGKGGSYMCMKRAGLPVIESLYFLPNKKLEALEYVKRLGGFPIVIKVAGGTQGVGVMSISSIESFNSVIDYIKSTGSAEVRVMKFVPHEFYGRLVVVGDEVVASTRDFAPIGDFRTNAWGLRERKGGAYMFDDNIQKLAVEAVASTKARIGGVDVVFAPDGNFYITEVNVPFDFAETQAITGIDVADSIISLMIEKSTQTVV